VSDRFFWRPRSLRFAALFAALALALAACGDDDDSGDSGGGGGGGGEEASNADKPVKLAFFVAHQANPYEQSNIDEAEKTAAENNAEITLFDGANDPQKQVAQCQDAIASQQYDAFVLKSVAGPAMVGCVRQAIDAGIPVVANDTPIGPRLDTTEAQVEGLTGSVLHLPVDDAKPHAAMTAEACGEGDCEIIYIFGPAAFTFAAESRTAFKKLIADEHPNVEIVAEASANFSPDEAYNITKQLLQKHPNVKVITSDSDPAALGIARALKELGKQDSVALIGGGGSEEGVEAVRSGEWFGTSTLVPRSMSRAATEMGIKAARGEDVGETEINAVTDLATSDEGVINRDNASDFEAEWTLGS
jgi:ribose transport system substrate-binding protein